LANPIFLFPNFVYNCSEKTVSDPQVLSRSACDRKTYGRPLTEIKEVTVFHTIIVVGNLGRDPEMRYTPSGQAVTNFSVATSRQYTDSGGQQVKETIWFRISAWGKQAETCNQYLKKGSKVLVEGRLVPDPATGGPRIYKKQDGTMGSSFEVSASTVRFLSSRGESEGASPAGGETGQAAEAESDIPF
jgi:single-strand DNA-binding protein